MAVSHSETGTAMRLAVFASGGGSNFEAICDAIDAGRLAAEVVLCLADRESAGVLERARSRGIATAVVIRKAFADTPDGEHAFGEALIQALQHHHANFIALAGYLKKIPPQVVHAFPHRIVNIHPALLPAFGGKGMYGRRVHQAVVDHGARVSGATVHLVDAQYDSGPIVLQRCVPVLPDDSAETLAARVLEVEHQIYPEALALFADGRVEVDGRKTRVVRRADQVGRYRP